MASLLDIAPLRETVTVRGVALEVRGISAEALVPLFQRFGDVFAVFQAGEVGGIVTALKPAIAAVIAAATGSPGSAEAEAAAADLSLGEQAELLAVIRRLTMPKGLRPFLEDLAALGLPLGEVLVGLDGAASAPTSPSPSPG